MTSYAIQQQNRAAVQAAAANLSTALQAAGIGSEMALRGMGVRLEAAVKKELSQSGTGRVYRRRSVTHRASAPGRPPAVDTGRLRSSYTHGIERTATGPVLWVGTNVEYAPYLEMGTLNMAPRPHLRPVIERARTSITREVATSVATTQRKMSGIVRRGVGVGMRGI